ncbi:hypothetical protein AYO38_01640 [bacterium SCGC AG-212-C10]|nr:hypothetical protein AYO38_01640 [bacterium SCGC AG-212-C10]
MTNPRARGSRRIWLPAGVFGLLALAISARLVQLQVIQHDHYATLTRQEQVSSSTSFARRGSILDRNGNVVATSVDTWDVYVNKRAWTTPAKIQAASDSLALLLKENAQNLRDTVANSESVDVLIKRDVEYEVGQQVLHQGITGVIALPNTARVNPEGDLGASVIGFIGLDNNGLSGIEASYDDVLQGTPGRAVYERDTTGDPIPFGQYIASDPVPGKDVVLTIDRYLQQMAEAKLQAAVAAHQAKGGTILIMDPMTMEILALATTPSFKYSDLPLETDDDLKLLKNTAVTDLYEPGSVMKVITAAAAIDKGVVTPNTTYYDSGEYTLYDTTLKNFDLAAWGTQTMTGVLQHSINTGAIFMVNLLGRDVFQKYLDAFGFGEATGVDMNGEAVGIIRRPTDPGWSPVDLATQSFGQSIGVTPLQMASAIAAAINGGRVITPHFVKAYIDADGNRQDVMPVVKSQVISPEASATIRQMMSDVLTQTVPYPAKPKNYTGGGKSGTANVPIPNGSYDDRQIASYIGFAPLKSPKVLILVKLDENKDLQTGLVAAGPVFADLIDSTLAYLNVAPDDGVLVRAP